MQKILKRRTILFALLIFGSPALSLAQEIGAIRVDNYTEVGDPDSALLEQKALSFAQQLKKSNGAKGVLFFYTAIDEKNVDYCSKLGYTAEKRAKAVRDILVDRENIRAGSVILIDGYLRLSTELDFWIVPKVHHCLRQPRMHMSIVGARMSR